MDAFWPGVQVLLLLSAANMAPILARRLLGSRAGWPIDGGLRFVDGRPLLGASKTWRGLALGTLAAALLAPLFGYSMEVGATLGLLSLVGDALSSFLKRRLGVPSSGQVFGIDQVPEALLPLLVLRDSLGLPWLTVLGVTLAFLLLETPVAQLAHRLGLREKPY
jgi:CDP-2,3-bis-(O-geranylgeranyl)-sn-glycerol synthase